LKVAARRILLGTALAVATWLFFFADPPVIDSGVAEPAAARAPSGTRTKQRDEPIEILELHPRIASASRSFSLFGSTTWVAPPKPAAASAAPAPQAPPLPFTYVGKRFDGVHWEVFVNRGTDTLILRENEVVDGTYRIESVKPPQISVLYLPMNEHQALAIGPDE
jgi:hypothetical protein